MSDLGTLQRWEDSGGTWSVLWRAAGEAEVALRRCDGGEIADRLRTSDPEVLAYLDAALPEP
ncbi:hypothetical protein P0W64_17655 [Tsukamurella sp. 8F]|uniref:hypothetical protein n=1 Tax=unclassified Tsukamurella TaxID=2633480 RepID=UPI0023B90DC7|nr:MULTISPECIES: hypothetical protein [unclassified Tsukamurella]MDF0532402.1 hypothetical protein [Tsukamurella sp. 8J]MDF0588612.1 hypothetical protein [Tsukamurella sp. 8F]